MTFVPGQNAPLQAPVVTFRAESQTPFDVSALVADANLRALTSADFVFYNQPSTAGVQLDQSGIRVELDRLHPDAASGVVHRERGSGQRRPREPFARPGSPPP